MPKQETFQCDSCYEDYIESERRVVMSKRTSHNVTVCRYCFDVVLGKMVADATHKVHDVFVQRCRDGRD